MRTAARWGAGAGLVALALGGCTSPASDDLPQPVASSPAPDAEIVCGVAAGDVELATGGEVDGTRGDLDVADGGECTVLDPVGEDLLVVYLYPQDDPEAQRLRAVVDGDEDATGNPPTARVDPEVADGAVWGGWETPEPGRVTSTRTVTFWREAVAEVSLPTHAPGRTGRDEALALSQQVAQTYGLTTPRP